MKDKASNKQSKVETLIKRIAAHEQELARLRSERLPLLVILNSEYRELRAEYDVASTELREAMAAMIQEEIIGALPGFYERAGCLTGDR